jgi:hypothetical protein
MAVNCQQYCIQLVGPPPNPSFHSATGYSASSCNYKRSEPKSRDPELCLLSEEQNPFRKNTEQMFIFSTYDGSPGRAFWGDIICATDRYSLIELGNISVESMAFPY